MNNKIKNVSFFCRVVFQSIFVALPLLCVWAWVVAPEPLILLIGFVKANVIPVNYVGKILHTLTFTEKSLGFLVNLIPLSIELFIVYCLIKLFRHYELGEIFSLNNVRYIRNIGYALLISELINPFYQFAMGIILTINNPKGHRFASITLDQTNFAILLVALMVILISWIMAEGYKLREEQQLTV